MYFDPQASRGGRNRGRGGNRGVGRGGYRGGDGVGGFGVHECRKREMDAISLAKENAPILLDSNITVETNCFPIDVSKGKFHMYWTSYEFLENGKDIAGEGWKIDFQRKLLRTLIKSHANDDHTALWTEVEELCVCTGQAILAPRMLQVEDGFSILCKLKEKEGRMTMVERHYRVSIRYEGKVQLRLPEHTQWVNKIIACGMADTYGEHIGSDFIDIDSRVKRGNNLVTMDAISLNVARVLRKAPGDRVEAQDVLQLDVSTKASTTTKCSDLIQNLAQHHPQQAKRMISEALAGARVTTMFGEPTLLKVKRVDFDMKAGQPAKLRSDPNETFVQYFKRKFGATIHPDSPMLFCCFADRTKGRRLLPYPADTLQLSSLSPDQLTKLPLLCSIFPNDRSRRVKDALARILKSRLMIKVLQQYGIEIKTQGIAVTGKVLPAPTIYVPKGFNAYSQIAAAEHTGQAGFALQLKGLHHPNQLSKYNTLLMDEYFRRGNLPLWLKKYNVALPEPTVVHISSPQSFTGGAPGTFAMVHLQTKDTQLYNDFKQRFAHDSVVSQMAVTELSHTVAQMIAQQVSAKIGQLCFVVDVAEAGKAFKKRPVLVVSAVVGSALNKLEGKGRVVSAKLYTVAFVAFLAKGKSWWPYCNHYQVKGEEQVLYEDSITSLSAPTASSAARQQNAHEVLNKKFPDFLKEVVAHFNLRSEKGTMVLYRGAITDTETAYVANMEQAIEQLLPSWDTATVVVQPRSHFRICWDPASLFPNANVCCNGGYCNVPRGFVTNDFRVVFPDADPNAPVESFYLTGANCTLGQASNTYYLVLKRSPAIAMEELQRLTYSMCYMYPNKPDALPLPLPINCAYEYARKFGSCKAVKELPMRMRPTMHYL